MYEVRYNNASNMEYSKPITEVINQRYSCRTYQKIPIEAGVRNELAAYAAAQQLGPLGGPARFALAASSEGDLKVLKGLGTYGFIQGATGFIVGATPEDARHLEDFGYLLEKNILYATDLGLGTCWLGGTFTKSSFARKISIQEGELVPAVSSVGYPATKPRRLDNLIRRGAKADKRKHWECLFFDSVYDVPLTRSEAGDYAEALEMVRIGPSASNKQPWRIIKAGRKWHFYLQRSPGYRKRRLVKLTTNADLQRIDIGIAMCHFALSTEQLRLNGSWERQEPSMQKPDDFLEYSVSWVESKT